MFARTTRNRKRNRPQDDIAAFDFDIDAFLIDQFRQVKITPKSVAYWDKNKSLLREIVAMVVEAASRAGIDVYTLRNVLVILINGMDAKRLPACSALLSMEYAVAVDRDVKKLYAALRNCDLSQWLKLFDDDINHIIRFRMLIIDKLLENDYAADWLAIKALFLQPKNIEACFDRLENELQAFCKTLPADRRPKQRADGKYFLASAKDNPYERNKILSEYLYSWAQKNGFKHYAKITKGLSEEIFLDLLKNKTFFKDSATNVGSKHGVWSHALQWYCIVEHNKRTKFLKHDPVELYAAIGGDKNIKSSVLWNNLLDKVDQKFYSSPEFITAKLTNAAVNDAWPLLAGSVTRLQNKIAAQGAKYTSKMHVKHMHEADGGVVRREFKKVKR